MYLLPAIDLLDGKAVRLAQGDYNAVTNYSDDPVQQALLFKEQGAQWIHVVDLDGARDGQPANRAVIERIIAATGLRVEVGGGVRSLEAIEALATAGASRVVIGTKLVSDPDFAQAAVRGFGDLICAGIDARDGEVAIQGWQKGSGLAVADVVEKLSEWGLRHLVYTDISRDGMQSGVDRRAYQNLAAQVGFPVIASGGVATLDDIRSLAALGDTSIEGIITGRALYEAAFTVSQALAVLAESDRR